MDAQKKRRFQKPIIVSAEKEVGDGFISHDQRWSRNHVKHVIVDFDTYTVKVVLKNGDVSVTNYKEFYEDAEHRVSPTSDQSSEGSG